MCAAPPGQPRGSAVLVRPAACRMHRGACPGGDGASRSRGNAGGCHADVRSALPAHDRRRRGRDAARPAERGVRDAATDRPAAAQPARLRRRAEDDRARLDQALRSQGYYNAKIDLSIDAAAKPVKVVFKVDPGPRYRLRDVAIEVTPPDADLPLPSVAELGITPGTPAVAQTILDAETRLVERAKARGYALAQPGERRAVVDHDADAMDLTLRLNAGPPVRFGDDRGGRPRAGAARLRRTAPALAGRRADHRRAPRGRPTCPARNQSVLHHRHAPRRNTGCRGADCP